MINLKKPAAIVQNAIKQNQQKESKILAKQPSYAIRKLAPLTNQLTQKVPPKINQTFEKAFASSFQTIFSKGTNLINKSYQKDNAQMNYDVNEFILQKAYTKKNMRRFQTQANRATRKNLALSALEGSVLGLFGIGLPDIPLYLGVILKSMYEIAVSYGYSYETKDEQTFIMLLICAALAEQEEKQTCAKKCDVLGASIDQHKPFVIDQQALMQKASQLLAKQVLLAKFIQGIPVIGISGGITNLTVLRKITATASIKYHQRFLNKQQKSLMKDI